MVARFALCFAVVLSSAGCAAAPLPPAVQTPPDQCPAGWPVDPSSPLTGRALITFKNESSDAFGLQRVIIGLDDLALCWRSMPSKRGAAYLDANDLPAISLPLLEGEHILKLLVNLRGRSAFGVDLSGYWFEVRSSHKFHVDRARFTEVAAVVYEKGGPAMPPEERPAIRYIEREGGALVAPGPSGTAPKGP
jgi:hypothetical protein